MHYYVRITEMGDIICKVNCGLPQSLFGPVFMCADVACIAFINCTCLFKIYSPLISVFSAGIKLLVLSLLDLVPFLFVDNYFTYLIIILVSYFLWLGKLYILNITC